MGLLDQVLGNVLGSRLGGGTTGGLGGTEGGMSPIVMAVLALLAHKALNSNDPSSGLGDLLRGGGSPGSTGGSRGGLGGLLGGLLGGASGFDGDILASGLGGLLEGFNRTGHGEIARSWVGGGENRPIAPHQLEDALGTDTVNQLTRQTGMPRQDLLSELSHVLPSVVDQLTPQGRLPQEDELDRY